MAGRRSNAPAVAPCLLFLGGVAVALTGRGAWAAGLPPALPLMLWALGLVADRARSRWLVGASTLVLGLALGARDMRNSQARLQAWVPERGIPLELGLDGTLVAGPEIDADGQRLLVLEARPELDPDAPALRVLLRVRPSPAMQAVDQLLVGDRVRVWARVRGPRGFQNPGAPDARKMFRAMGLDAVGSVKSARLVEPLEKGPPGPARWAAHLRGFARSGLDRGLGSEGPVRALAGGMLLGDRAAIGTEPERWLQDAGLVHLVAISGLNVVLLFGGLAELGRRARLPSWILCLVLWPLLAAFALAVGARSSVLRAVLASSTVLLGRAVGREGSPLNSLALLAAGLVAAEPATLHDPGTQLTFLATAGILLFTRAAAGRIPLPAPLALPLGLSGAAYAATTPIVAWHFGQVAPVALIANLVAVPLGSVVLVAGYGTILLQDVPVGGSSCARLCRLATEGLLGCARLASSWPSGAFRVPAPSPAALALCYGALAGLAALGAERRAALRPLKERRLARLGTVLLAWGTTWIHLGSPPSAGSGALEAAVIDVGQGQSVLLRGPDGGRVLVDAGGSFNSRFDPGERVVTPYVSRAGLRLDVLVLSHDHVDHVGGAFAVLRELEVGELWLGPGSSRSILLRELAARAREQGSAVVLAAAGHRARRGGVELAVLAPPRHSYVLGDNDRSLVVLAGAAPARILIPGDLEQAGEAALVASAATVRAEAYVASHHGSRRGSSSALLARVQPKWVLVSAGFANAFGHPHRTTLERFDRIGATVLRTDRDGLILLQQAPGGWRVRAPSD